MQTPFTSFVVGVAIAFLLTSSGDGQDRSQSDPRHVDTSTLEKRIAELEGKISVLQKEVKELRRELRAQSSMAVVPLRNVEAKEAVEVIREVYRDHPGIEVTALGRTNLVMIQADKKTKEEIVDLLHGLDAPRGRATANRLMFPEDIERAMLMDAFRPAVPR